MRNVWLMVALCFLFFPFISQSQTAKYVFFFIGDGMGVNQVHGTSLMLQSDSQNTDSLLFASFPIKGLSKTYSQSSLITDSAAGGTALSTGKKTSNGTIGMDASETIPFRNLAERAHDAGRRIGIVTSVSIDHATPAVFYSHRPLRSSYYEIGSDLPKSGFSFFGGSGFLEPTNAANENDEDLFQLCADSGYIVVRGEAAFIAQQAKADKLILLQSKGHNPDRLPFALDRKAEDLTLNQLTRSAISFLQKEDQGFFLMVEGGMIDWSSHSNDAYTTFCEVKDLDESVRLAYEFYRMHPDSTLIVVTADHETGGLGLGNGPYELHLEALKAQKRSQAMLSADLLELKYQAKERHTVVSWQQVEQLLRTKMGFWETLYLSASQEVRLKDTYRQMIQEKGPLVSKSEYFVDDLLAKVAVQIVNEIAGLGWTSENHTGAYAPIFAIGVGAEQFNGMLDNTEIPQRIARIAHYPD